MCYRVRVDKALRAAVLTVFESTRSENLVTALKIEAKKIAEQLLLLDSNTFQFSEDIRKQNIMIDELIDKMSLGFTKVSHHNDSMREHRASFDSDHDNGVSTFLVPTTKGSKAFSSEEKFIKKYLKTLHDFDLLKYSGIKQAVGGLNLIIAFSFFRMHQEKSILNENKTLMDKAFASMDSYFSITLTGKIDDIDREFEEEGIVSSYLSWNWQRENYLNARRSYELFLFGSSTLLWFISQAVNKNGVQFGNTDKIFLCEKICEFYEEMLRYINDENLENASDLINVITDITYQISLLKRAFYEKSKGELSSLNLNQTIKKSIIDLNDGLFTVIFRSALSAKSICFKLKKFIDIINELSLFLKEKKHLLKGFNSKLHVKLFMEPVVNETVSTVIDLLIVVCHATPTKRLKLIHEWSTSSNQDLKNFSKILFELSVCFIDPIYQRLEGDRHFFSFLDKDCHKKIAERVAKQLIPLFCFTIETCQIPIATDPSLVSKQIEKIIKMKGRASAYYSWNVINLILKDKGEHCYLNSLIDKVLYLSCELNSLSFLQCMFSNHPKFLSDVSCLKFLKQTYKSVKGVFFCISQELGITDHLLLKTTRLIFTDVNQSINGSLKAIDFSLLNPSQDILKYNERINLQRDLNKLNQLYLKLFNRVTGINDFHELGSDDLLEVALDVNDSYDHSSYILNALIALINTCQKGLSSNNTNSFYAKHEALSYLLSIVEQFTSCTLADAKKVLKELAMIVMTNRPSYFFPSKLGETHSAKVLYQEMLRLRFDDDFPIAKLLLGENFNIYNASEQDVCVAMQNEYLNSAVNGVDALLVTQIGCCL